MNSLFIQCFNKVKALKEKKKRGEYLERDKEETENIIEFFATYPNKVEGKRWEVLKNQTYELLVPSQKRYKSGFK